jgi:hypothetical protein
MNEHGSVPVILVDMKFEKIRSIQDFYDNEHASMAVLLFLFALGRLYYSQFHNSSDYLFMSVEAFMIVVFFFFSYCIILKTAHFIRGFIISFLFIATAFIPRSAMHEKIGIIDFVWLVILGISLGAIIFAHTFDVMHIEADDDTHSPEYLQQMSQELQFLLGKALDLLIALGAIVSVAMSILWAGEVWREEQLRNQYIDSLYNSKCMAVSYFIIFLSVGIWILTPLYRHFNSMKNKM